MRRLWRLLPPRLLRPLHGPAQWGGVRQVQEDDGEEEEEVQGGGGEERGRGRRGESVGGRVRFTCQKDEDRVVQDLSF